MCSPPSIFSSVVFHHVPIDKLLFLQSRMRDRSKEDAVLVSSEGGHACFWELLGGNEAKGRPTTFSYTAEIHFLWTALPACTLYFCSVTQFGFSLCVCVCFHYSNWNSSKTKQCLPSGSFPLTKVEGETVLSLATDSSNQYLVAGDTSGNIAVFDISNYAHANQVSCDGILLIVITANDWGSNYSFREPS